MLFVPQPFYTTPKRLPAHCKLLCHVPERGRVPLLHNHGQVHSRMNGAIQVEGTSRIEWSNGLASAAATELHVVHYWRAILLHWLRVSIHPTAVGNDMGCR